MARAKKTISAPTPNEIESFQGKCHKCGKYGHTAKEFRSSSQGGADARSVEKYIMDNVGHLGTHHHTKIHRKEDGKVVKKEMAKEHRKGSKSNRGTRWNPRERQR